MQTVILSVLDSVVRLTAFQADAVGQAGGATVAGVFFVELQNAVKWAGNHNLASFSWYTRMHYSFARVRVGERLGGVLFAVFPRTGFQTWLPTSIFSA